MSQIRVDTITNQDGTGSPTFPNGLSFDNTDNASFSGTVDAASLHAEDIAHWYYDFSYRRY